MSRSERYTEGEVRAMLSLACELAELPPDPQLRTSHMLTGLCRLVGAKVGTSTRARHDFTGYQRRVTVLAGQMVGVDELSGQEALASYLKTLEPKDPLSEPLYSQSGRQVTRGREQLMNRFLWHRSAHFNEVRRAMGVDDCIASKIVLGPGGQVQTICVHRALGDPPFTAKQWRLIDLFHTEMRPMIDLPMHRSLIQSQLSPRMQQVLACLLAGDGAKQISAKLDLSVFTIRDYIKQIYERFNVSGRSELFACFARQ